MKARWLCSLIISVFIMILFTEQVQAAVIMFDEFNASDGPVVVPDQYYQQQGVVFQDLEVVNVSQNPLFIGHPGYSTPNVALLRTVTAIFQYPGTGSPGTTDCVAADFFDSTVGSNLVVMTAYDIGNNYLGHLDVVSPGDGHENLVLQYPGIHKVVMTTDADTSAFDNFTFSDVQAIPIPSTVWLFVSGLIGLMGLRRKFRTA